MAEVNLIAELAELRKSINALTEVLGRTLGQAVEVPIQSAEKEEAGWIDWSYNAARNLRKYDRIVFCSRSLDTLKAIGWVHDDVKDEAVFRVTDIDLLDTKQPVLFEAIIPYASCWPEVDIHDLRFRVVDN
ncbi:hypothetical protein QE320_gp100 [Pseudomonas phage EM]|uniref:Uncharacterized protein n=1 Tax=Pseudomonas phage EM TaxID=2936914 RepID=A0AAE9HJ45_9CAUD|nr:hypothetical protein QE320_gp100 [Pseudomonas phage EM]UPW35954.1 hypothetical protein EM_169 [Pseudomonas phage EM]